MGALSRLGVTESSAPPYLTVDELGLREGLLARAVQLGDPQSGGSVDIAVPLLMGEVAYEQWHRLLFARFLAENGLLMHPEFGAPVSLNECEELAASLGEPDGWSVAARFASQILPGIFRLDDPAVLVRLAPEDRLALEKIVTGLPAEVFTADDALGWVYQYWQSKQKKLVNDSGRKIGGADISPVTQLFTEDYMVRFLLENSLGAWWAARYPHSPLIAGWDYLRFDQDGAPAAGSFDGWPKMVDQVTVMDPCCGSGHFLVAAFGMLWRMRAEVEGLAPADAQDAVLRDNLFGLELDPRCTQIAMFNLALEAWKQGGYRELPVPNVACSGIPAKSPLNEWTVLADGDVRLEAALSRLHELFKDADTLGSLIDPRRAAEQDDLFNPALFEGSVDWDAVAPLLEQALTKDDIDPAATVFGHAAVGIARAADLLSRSYTLVATNPPWVGGNRQQGEIATFLESSFPSAKWDLATAFLQRSNAMVTVGGSRVAASPNAWTSLKSYKRFREWVLINVSLRMAARLGAGAFAEITGQVVQAVLTVWTRSNGAATFARMLDASGAQSIAAKSDLLRTAVPWNVDQSGMAASVSARILFEPASQAALLSEYADSYWGIGTGDGERFARFLWEVPNVVNGVWEHYQGVFSGTSPFTGRNQLLRWESGAGPIVKEAKALKNRPFRGSKAWGRHGIAVNQTGNLDAALYGGQIFQNGVAAVIPKAESLLPAIWCFISTAEYRAEVRKLDSKVAVTNNTLVQVPFDIEHWRDIAAERYPDGLPEPSSSDQTQWLFKGDIVGSLEPLQVGVARLLGFEWPDQQLDVNTDLTDVDGIVCLPPIAGEAAAGERLRGLLAAAYGSDWATAKLDELLVPVGAGPADLESWLRESFFKQHTKVFQNRPFVWHIWDGRADGFSALVNYHRLDRKTLEKLTYTTLGWWIQRQKDDAANDVPGAAARLVAADRLKSKLELILQGEPPYDIYVRWKSLAEQPIGWDPDLDDGVRMNIRPFIEAGILRTKFTINWNKDRGTNPDGSERFNDLHHTIAEKHQARGSTT